EQTAGPTSVAVERLKLYLRDSGRLIDVEEMIRREAAATATQLSGAFDVMGGGSALAIAPRVRAYEETCERLVGLLVCAAYYGDSVEPGLLIDAVQELADGLEIRAGVELWLRLREFPIMFAFYALGVAWTARRAMAKVGRLL